MDIFDYINAVTKRKFMIIGGIALVTLIAAVEAFNQSEYYKAEAVLVMRKQGFDREEKRDSYWMHWLETEMATLERMVNSREVVRAAVEKYNREEKSHERNWRSLRNNVSVDSVGGSRLLRVTVTHADPELAHKLANFIAGEAVKRTGHAQKKHVEMWLTRQALLTRLKVSVWGTEIMRFLQGIAKTTEESDTQNTTFNAYFPTSDAFSTTIDRVQGEGTELTNRWIETYEMRDSGLSSGRTYLVLVDRAGKPGGPSGPKRRRIIGVAALGALGFFLFLAAFLEFLEIESRRRDQNDKTADQSSDEELKG